MSKNTIDRAYLTRVANLVKPALAAQPYVPALVHILFKGDVAIAYNDVSAIRVAAPEIGLDRCVPGDMLIRALGSFTAETLAVSRGDGDALVLKSGRSTVKVPTLAPDKFPLTWPTDEPVAAELKITDDVLAGVSACLLSVGKDATRPAHLGVTLDRDDDGFAILFSTDNTTLSRYQTATKVKLPGDAPVIMPRFFCEQLVALCKVFPKVPRMLLLRDGSLEGEIGEEASVFTKTPVDLQPADFPKIFSKFCDVKKLDLAPIPDSLDAALGRALLVLSGEVVPKTVITEGADHLLLKSASDLGESEDRCTWESAGGASGAVTVNPALVARGAKACSMMGLTDRVTILADADLNFVHLVAHLAG